jgi:hypothetical protein
VRRESFGAISPSLSVSLARSPARVCVQQNQKNQKVSKKQGKKKKKKRRRRRRRKKEEEEEKEDDKFLIFMS